jgi:hypothetical protein
VGHHPELLVEEVFPCVTALRRRVNDHDFAAAASILKAA